MRARCLLPKPEVPVISTKDILTSDGKFPNRAKAAPLAVVAAAGDLAARLSKLLALYGSRPPVSSGFRTPEANKAAGGAPRSSHLEGKAVDFQDTDRKFSTWCLANLNELKSIGLWLENPAKTPTWTHLQSRPVPGKVVFNP